MLKTKIICTLGPATDKGDVLESLIQNGMNVARFNFSHGTHKEHLGRFSMLKEIREKYHKPVAALLDTKGPEIRLGEFSEAQVQLKKGQQFILTSLPCIGTAERATVSYSGLIAELEVGKKVLIDDGLVELEVIDKHDTALICEVKNDGVIGPHKGINVPYTKLNLPFLSEQDEKDLLFAIQNEFDFIATSFTQCAENILDVKAFLRQYHGEDIKVIAKIENAAGVEHIDEIINVADGIMIARGDMGIELPSETVPAIQKMIIKKVYEAGKQVITATQMLDSMMKNPRPTRAETTDVANAIYDGTSAIMLSGETAAGLYPVESLQTMRRIAEKTEEDIDYIKRFNMQKLVTTPTITSAISHATCTTAHDIRAKAIITVTKSGRTACMISKYRPACIIMGCSPEMRVVRQLSMSWGVVPLYINEEQQTEELCSHALASVVDAGYLKQGDLTVMTAGVPLGISGMTNMIKVYKVE
nr:pyruvate kinase [uncultured Cellulosilyticum sp.]